MVGVPGRSKACITCRKRRKGCDGSRPACSQRGKAGLSCEGYDAQRVFVVSTPSSRRTGYRVPHGSQTPGLLFPPGIRHQVSRDATNLRLLARPEEERRCIDLFWEAYFPAGQPIPSRASRSFTCAWTDTARNLYRENHSLRYALWANCLLVTGRRCGAAWMLREASKAYGRALGILRRSLEAPYQARRDASIATIKLLDMFEIFSRQGGGQRATETHGSQHHHSGELTLFIARTPMAHIDGDAHNLFSDERVDMALAAVLRRERFVLGTPEWKSIPWQAIPKDFKDILVDVLVDIPALVEDFDNMRLCADETRRKNLRLELIQRCWGLDGQLLTWLGMLSEIGAEPSQHSCLEATVKDAVTHVAQVHGMTLFWTTSLVLYSILRTVSGPQAEYPEHTDPMHHARKLVGAISSLLQPSARLYGWQSAALPLQIALQYTQPIASTSSPDREAVLGSIKRLRDCLHAGPMDLFLANARKQDRGKSS